ncbi:hypothetical protein J7E88_27090 [Streptomyces sp. ISL-10]|uniref:hypothetical protein n=1 Tax=Streptomyces sp. ISL-10 TaxID=2819172 RepID=UPI001BEB4274|nr:hypothetical protein [Streptomyces sp. ISL-10]MBT2368884.1 hypothetical protein [Streptomyces sp. ISL-10]
MSTGLPGASGETRRFFRKLVEHHQDSVGLLAAQGAVPAATWDRVERTAALHDGAVRRTLRDLGPRADVLRPEMQGGITVALDQFAAALGVRGTVVQAWGTAIAMNKETQAGSPADRRVFWWKDRPIAFACILHPAADGQPLVDGLLLYGGGQYRFTPALETQEQTSWDKSKVRAEDRDPMTAVLHLDPSTGWRRADIACRTVVIDGFFTR